MKSTGPILSTPNCMNRRPVPAILLAFLGILTLSCGVLSQTAGVREKGIWDPSQILVKNGLSSVYITFEKSGKADPLFSGESNDRFWLRLHNNTRDSIYFCYSRVEDRYGEVAVRYDLVEEKHFGNISGPDELPDFPGSNKSSTATDATTPPGNGNGLTDACRSYTLASGRSIVFSVPKNHLVVGNRTFRLQIPFEYGWDNRSMIAGAPTHYLYFSTGNLPFQGNQTGVNRISDSNALTVYSILLQALRSNRRFDDALRLDEIQVTDTLVYRDRTIAPEGVEQINDVMSEYPNLAASFMAANKTAEFLKDEYEVHTPARPFSGPRPPDKFFSKAHSKFSSAKAAVSFSNIGIDSEDKTGLVYIEYFSPRRGVLKFYLLLDLERWTPGPRINVGFVVSSIRSFKVIPVR